MLLFVKRSRVVSQLSTLIVLTKLRCAGFHAQKRFCTLVPRYYYRHQPAVNTVHHNRVLLPLTCRPRRWVSTIRDNNNNNNATMNLRKKGVYDFFSLSVVTWNRFFEIISSRFATRREENYVSNPLSATESMILSLRVDEEGAVDAPPFQRLNSIRSAVLAGAPRFGGASLRH
jgi:hypothetical protein